MTNHYDASGRELDPANPADLALILEVQETAQKWLCHTASLL